jgi:hypothetical protein
MKALLGLKVRLCKKATVRWRSEGTPLLSRPYLLCEGAVIQYFEV